MLKKLPTPKWVKRDYPFADLKVGDEIFVPKPNNTFRTLASRWFKSNPPKTYTTSTETRDGKPGILLTRMNDSPQ